MERQGILLLTFALIAVAGPLIGFAQTDKPLMPDKIIPLQSKPFSPDMVWVGGQREQNSEQASGRMVSNVKEPSLMVYLPKDPSTANGTALVIAPGGGFHLLSIDNEGVDVAKWCVENGIAAFVLQYRLVPTGESPMQEFFDKMRKGGMDQIIAPYIDLAKADGLAAIAHVRQNAEQYGINRDRIGIVGFSAGGTVAAAAGIEYTSDDDRPDFIAPIYGALQVVNLENLPAKPMPMFLAVGSRDEFGFQTPSLELYRTWNAAKVPAELHVYASANHGFGMKRQGRPSDRWIDSFKAWLDDLWR